ncbi:hypothetical protein BDV96DRAFT_607493 [Lophiotrema nucula]|uniref:C2H2-type domain-containing protein n=1 Tax=Lophiotrema nucula TaxID=690887 RepID=A0A6A5YGV4_9PLEO|nr:hypothetical protein BDV96DRAFT_607493 [Lophiotrema nucula]
MKISQLLCYPDACDAVPSRPAAYPIETPGMQPPRIQRGAPQILSETLNSSACANASSARVMEKKCGKQTQVRRNWRAWRWPRQHAGAINRRILNLAKESEEKHLELKHKKIKKEKHLADEMASIAVRTRAMQRTILWFTPTIESQNAHEKGRHDRFQRRREAHPDQLECSVDGCERIFRGKRRVKNRRVKNRRKHEQTLHGNIRFYCRCGKSFLRKDGRKKHKDRGACMKRILGTDNGGTKSPSPSMVACFHDPKSSYGKMPMD